jgi:hypothetical protein
MKMIRDERERRKKTEYMREWRKKYPERTRESTRKYYQKIKKEDPVKYARLIKNIRNSIKNRYQNDPEFRKRMLEYNRKYRERLKKEDPEKYHRIFSNYSRHIRPFVSGLKCKCGFDIKINMCGGRKTKKRLIQCPKCRMYWYKHELETVKIPRDIKIDISYGSIKNKNLTGNKKCNVCGSIKHNIKMNIDGKWERELIHNENCPLTKSLKELEVKT